MTDQPKSRQVCVVMRILRFANGEQLLVPFGLYEDAAAGKHAGEQAQQSVQEMLRTCVVAKRYQNPQGGHEMEPLMGLQDFLRMLGMTGIQHAHAMNDVQGVIVAPPKSLIIPTKH
jgi:hypothetical protein